MISPLNCNKVGSKTLFRTSLKKLGMILLVLLRISISLTCLTKNLDKLIITLESFKLGHN